MIEKEKQIIEPNPIETVDNPTILDAGGDCLALLPLKNVVILPKSILPIIVGRKQSIQAVEYALKQNKTLFITAQRDSKIEEPTEKDIFHSGTRSVILQVMRMPNGALKILAEGICRSEIVRFKRNDGFMGVEYKDIPTTDLDETNVETEALWRQLRELYASYAKLNEKVPEDLITVAKTAQEVDYIVDTIAVHIHLSFNERQTILETPSLKERMLKLCKYLSKEIEILQTEQRIKGRIQQQVEKSQREYYLNEQIKAIQKELGREDQTAELNELQEKAKALKLSPEAREKIEKEFHRLEQMPPLSSEAVVSRNYVDWIMSLPWGKTSKDTISLDQAEKILNRDHAGLKKVKERIIEFLAAKKFSKKTNGRSPIICLVGPPGVGKTSLARSVADSLGRSFARISLGGIRDEAEIRGHRRTYIGALPGKIIHAIKKAGTLNPVILLDEIDKISKDIHGDPAAALLEVLDPEQNRTFVDHFLDIDFDLSNVMFLTTANSVDGIPLPLYDRMEIIPLSGYTEQEKVEIAQGFLIPKALKEHGLRASQFKLPVAQLREVITKYTQEAGVRQLERTITKLMRKAIQILLKDKTLKSVKVTDEYIREWLGIQKFKKTSLNDTKKRIGLATGLAWTEVGGDILEIEATAVQGKGSLALTGQLGDVMQESAQAALSYIRGRNTELGLKNNFHSSKDIHIHIPEGATPKDGPSAGITICSSMISALTGRPTKAHLAMTGEITLQGRVLPVGGLKEKLLAARQHDMKTIILSKENYDDIQEILKDTNLGSLKFVFASTMDEVLTHAFTKNPFKQTKSRSTRQAKTAKKRK